MEPLAPSIRFEAHDCSLTLTRRPGRVVVLTLVGRDLGELGEAPFRELERYLSTPGEIELFIDARRGVSATLDVSGRWAVWLGNHKARLDHVSMLTGSRFIQLTAELVRSFSTLGEKMRLYTEAAAFEAALASATERAFQC